VAVMNNNFCGFSERRNQIFWLQSRCEHKHGGERYADQQAKRKQNSLERNRRQEAMFSLESDAQEQNSRRDVWQRRQGRAMRAAVAAVAAAAAAAASTAALFALTWLPVSTADTTSCVTCTAAGARFARLAVGCDARFARARDGFAAAVPRVRVLCTTVAE
jgi:hypothetical protein